jgi:hypothetical protein
MRRRSFLAIGAIAPAAVIAENLLLAGPASAASTVFTMTSFSNSNETDLFTYQSSDGLTFNRLGTGKVYTPPSGLLRDPSVTKNTSDRRYWVAYTTGWKGNTIGLASSADLKRWTFKRNIVIGPNINIAWAPEWFKDTDGSYNLLVHLRYSGQTSASPYLVTARDAAFTSWTSPIPLGGLQETSTANYIDSSVVKLGNTYHIFVKNDHTKYIEHATATRLTGPYTVRNRDDWAGWGVNREGPSLYQLDTGAWRIILDGYKDHRYWYSDSADTFQTWTPRKELPNGLSGFIRHATVLRERL